MKLKLLTTLSLFVFLLCSSIHAQSSYWTKSNSNGTVNGVSVSDKANKKSNIYSLDVNTLKTLLNTAPLRGSVSEKTTIISMPNVDGAVELFRVFEAPTFDEELSALYPEIKSYVGFNIDNSGARLRLSISHKGIQTMVSYVDKPMTFMQQVKEEPSKYYVYQRAENTNNTFKCSTIESVNNENLNLKKENVTYQRDANDNLLRSFRIAYSVTGEYTQYHGGTVSDALAAINATMARVNEVYETDMAVTFQVIAASTSVIYTNASTDPYSNANVGTASANSNNANGWGIQVQNTLTDNIGNAAYDIGHLFGASGGGGNAGCIGCVCVDDTTSNTDKNKGSAYTSPSDGNPQGDFFDIDYVAHEIGHQMGANHTWAFNTEGTNVNSEPGSGTTIMAYAGITGDNNVQSNSDAYFHYHSIKQILDNLVTRTCWTSTAIANSAPVADAGQNHVIPQGTAYVLKGDATDANGDTLSYCWEQTDSGQVTNTNFGPTLTAGSMTRSLLPTPEKDRYIPKVSRVIAGQLTESNPTINDDWETVATVARNMQWALTVRDRAVNGLGQGGQSSFDLMQITVNEIAGPFIVTSQNSNETWNEGTTETVTWDVAGTNVAPVSTANVNILLSTDGGLTYPVVVKANTPNDGSQVVNVPVLANPTTTARIKVEAAGNIYYAISSSNFEITAAQPDFSINTDELSLLAFCNEDSVTYNLDYETFRGFSETTNFTATGNPAGTIVNVSPSSLSATGVFTVTVSSISSINDGVYPIIVTATSATKTKTIDLALEVESAICDSEGTLDYQTGNTGVIFNDLSNLNNGKATGYTDYTIDSNLVTDVIVNTSYDLSVFVNTDGNVKVYTKVWIDWNQNCEFDIATEEYYLGETFGVSNALAGGAALSVTVPVDAVLGNTTMRVITKYSPSASTDYPTKCETAFDGETEDYKINVKDSTLSINEEELSDFAIYPNPNNGEFTIQFNSNSNSNIEFNLLDIRGRLVCKKIYNNTGSFNKTLNFTDLESGLYIVNINDGERKMTKKIIVE